MNTEEAVEILWASVQRGVHEPAELFGKLTMDEAYRVQLGILSRHEASGDKLVGWKVGLTAKAIQAQVGFHEPVFGYLLQSGALASGATLEFPALIAPGIENELCLTVGKSLSGPSVTYEQARSAITHVRPAFEVIEKRGGLPLDMPLALGNNAQQKAFVTGIGLPVSQVDLSDVTVEVLVNGQPQEIARSTEVAGTPVASVQWLANKLAGFGRSLEAGSLVMSGSFTKQYAVNMGDELQARFDRFGDVFVRFS